MVRQDSIGAKIQNHLDPGFRISKGYIFVNKVDSSEIEHVVDKITNDK
jgi:hypothetical protein